MKQIGINYNGIKGLPTGHICMNCAQEWEEEFEGEFDTDSGISTYAIDYSFVCQICGNKIEEEE